ncbi:MAG: Gfo/Idh/MocA family oxidoreductase [Pseudomonadota bacterium]
MQISPLKIAVVGAGLIGKKHIELVSSRARLHSIVDPLESAKALADSHDVLWFPDLAQCLEAGQPDGVIIASPNAFHREHAKTCLTSGIPVLVEKPLTDSVTSGRDVVRCAHETGTPLLVGHHRRHSPIIKAASNILSDNRLGRLVSVNAIFWLNKPTDYFDATWRTKAGGGPTYINLIHDIDLLQHLCGPIASVQAREANDVRGLEVEDTSAIIVSFANGALGTIAVSDTISAPWSWELTAGENPAYPKTDQSCYTIGGTKAALSLPDLRVWTHRGTQSWWSPIEIEQIDVADLDPVAAQFEHFLDVIAGKAAPLVTAEDGLCNIEVLEAIKHAARSGTVVRVTPNE